MLAAARTAFAERGFDGATIRGIAADAGVDPALVHHYFGSKDKLFLAAVEAPADPAELLPEVLAAPGRSSAPPSSAWRCASGTARAPAGSRCCGPRSATSGRRSCCASSSCPRCCAGGRTLDLAPDERAARAALVASQLIGLVMARYVLQLEPLASASPESLVAAIGPTVQRYLTGDVPPG